MKKALAILTASLAILGGLVLYGNMSADRGPTDPYIEPVTDEAIASSDEIYSYEEEAQSAPGQTAIEESPFEMAVTEEEAVWNEEVEEQFQEEKNNISDTAVSSRGCAYAYELLNDEERAVYDAVYKATVDYEAAAAVPTTDTAVLDKAFNYMMIDHPEIFYVEGYKYTRYMLGKKLMRITYSADYTCNQSERDSRAEEAELIISTILMNISDTADDFDKVRFVFETLIESTEYDLSAPDNQNILSVFLGKRSVCQGYAKATQLLLNRLGMQSTLITGRIKGGESHAWNAVNADGEWYLLDTTWGDASYQSDVSDDTERSSGLINYDYMCVTSELMGRTHQDDGTIRVPLCTAVDDNYYVHEGLCFDEYDENKVRELVDRAVQNGMEAVTFHATDDVVYDNLITELIDNQVIFRYLPDGGSRVRYSSSPNSRSVTFWL